MTQIAPFTSIVMAWEDSESSRPRSFLLTILYHSRRCGIYRLLRGVVCHVTER